MIRDIHGVLGIAAATGSASRTSTPSPATGTFDAALREAVRRSDSVTFSGHAQERLAQSNIVLGQNDVAAIGEAVERARSAGGRESLVLMDDMALVVSIPNKTVITVVDRGRMRNNVVTNIDSVVIASSEPKLRQG